MKIESRVKYQSAKSIKELKFLKKLYVCLMCSLKKITFPLKYALSSTLKCSNGTVIFLTK